MLKNLFLIFFVLLALNIFGQPETREYNEKPDVVYLYDTVIFNPDTIYYTDTIYEIEENLTGINKDYHAFLQTTGSFNFPFLNFNYSGNNEYINTFNKESKPVFSFNVGGNFGIIYKDFILLSGISYSCIREKLWHNPTNIKINTYNYNYIDTVDTYYIVSNNDTSWYYATLNKNLVITDSVYLKTPYINKFQSLILPVKLGYGFHNKNLDINLLIGGKLYFNIKDKTPLYVLNENNSLTEINKKNEINKISFSLEFSVQSIYKINNAFGILFEAGYQNMIRGFYNASSAYKLNIESVNLSIGLNYRMNFM